MYSNIYSSTLASQSCVHPFEQAASGHSAFLWILVFGRPLAKGDAAPTTRLRSPPADWQGTPQGLAKVPQPSACALFPDVSGARGTPRSIQPVRLRFVLRCLRRQRDWPKGTGRPSELCLTMSPAPRPGPTVLQPSLCAFFQDAGWLSSNLEKIHLFFRSPFWRAGPSFSFFLQFFTHHPGLSRYRHLFWAIPAADRSAKGCWKPKFHNIMRNSRWEFIFTQKQKQTKTRQLCGMSRHCKPAGQRSLDEKPTKEGQPGNGQTFRQPAFQRPASQTKKMSTAGQKSDRTDFCLQFSIFFHSQATAPQT